MRDEDVVDVVDAVALRAIVGLEVLYGDGIVGGGVRGIRSARWASAMALVIFP